MVGPLARILIGLIIVGAIAAAQLPPSVGSADAVEVDVVALDDQGRTVQGLVESDFRVKEDGRPVAIDSFSEVVTLGTGGRDDARIVALVLDDAGVATRLTTRVQEIARLFLASLGPADRVSVVRVNSLSEEAVGDRGMALSRIAEYRAGMKSINGREALENLLQTVTKLSRTLESIPHRRKAIVCIGSPGVCDVEEQMDSHSLLWPYWVDALAMASRANASVYAIDPVGATGTVTLSGSTGLVAQTGGDFLYNSNAFAKAVERFLRQASHYYLLGYRAPTSSSHELHKIDVSTPRKDVQLRARRSRG